MTVGASCRICGADRNADDSGRQLGWVHESENGTSRWLCPSCARAHVREIEGKLPSEQW